MSLFTNLKSVWQEFLDWLSTIGDDVMDFVKPAAELIAKNGGKILIRLAEQAVEQAALHGGSNEEKFAIARKYIENGLKDELQVGLNAINVAIEMAVAARKSKG